MTSGIYAYWDNINGYYAYVGKDSNIDGNTRHKHHKKTSRYDDQPFNRVLQNNPDRYEYRVIMEGDYNDWQLNQMEKLCIKSFKTFHYDYPERSVFNFTRGGGGSNGYEPSEETKKKISKTLTGKTHSEETKKKMSKTRNTTGYLNVSKVKSRRYSQGFYWQYRYYDNGKRKAIRSVDIRKLEENVKSKGLTWEKL